MRHTIITTAISVEERFAPERTTNKDAEGKWQFGAESLGWFVKISAHAAIAVGAERPDIKAGDTVRITLEKVVGQ